MDSGRLTRVVIEIDMTSRAFEKDPEMELCRLLHSIQIMVSKSGLATSVTPLADWDGLRVGQITASRSH